MQLESILQKSIKKFLKIGGNVNQDMVDINILMVIGNQAKKMNFLNKKFDLAISLGCIHFFRLYT